MAKAPHADRIGEVLHLTFTYDPALVAEVKTLGRATWRPAERRWELPYSEATLDRIKRIFPNVTFGASLKSSETTEAQSLMEAEERKYLPLAKDAPITDFKFRTEPMWHQRVSFNFARSLDQSALFLEQGLGKTKVLIDLATWRFRKGQVHRVLVVCPNSVTGQWVEEVRRHGHEDFSWVGRLEGSGKQRVRQLEAILSEDRRGFIVTNYESLLGLWDWMMKRQVGGARLFQMMALDESSKIKHAQAKRSQICWKLGMTVKYRNVLTGTPITQTGEDVFSQYRFLKSQVFGPYATAFRSQYLIMGGFEMRQVIGYRNFPDFLRKVYSVAVRFTKDRCLDLPAKVYQRRTVRMDEDVSRRYRQLEKECVAEFAGTTVAAPLVMTKLMKMSQVTGGFVYEQGEDGERIGTTVLERNPKLDDLEEFIEEVGAKKVIVWCRFREEIRAVTSFLNKAAVAHVAIHGDVPAADRAAAVAKFQDDPSCRVFLGQVSTAGLGITLTAAEYAYYYSNTYSLEDRLQSEDRCHRIGLRHSVVYVDCVAETADGRRTIDHDVLDVLRGKESFANEVSTALVQRMAQRQSAAPDTIKNPAHLRKHSRNSDPVIEEESF